VRVTVDTSKCIAGAVRAQRTDVFDQRDEDGIVVLLNQPTRRPGRGRAAGRHALPRAGHHRRGLTAMPERVVIVGASAAGLTTAEALRRRGYDGTLNPDRRRTTSAVRPATAVQAGPRRQPGTGPCRAP